MAAILDPWLMPLFGNDFLRASPTEVTLGALPETAADRARLASFRGRVAVVIPASACLRRLVTLPRAARAKAEQAIALHIKAKMPSAASGLVWTSRLVESPGDHLVYECQIVKDAHVQDLLAWATKTGVRISEVRIAGNDAASLWNDRPHRGEAARNWAGATFLAVSVTTAVTVGLLEMKVRELEDIVQTKTGHVEALTRRLEEAQAEGSETASRSAKIADLTTEFLAGLRPLSQLSDIAVALPEGVWLSSVSFAGSSWQLSGFARGEVTATVQALQTMTWAENVRLDGPSSYDSYTGQNRFDIALNVAAAAATE